jgi:hypothetical protein
MSTYPNDRDPWEACEGVLAALRELPGAPRAWVEGGGAAGPWVATEVTDVTVLWAQTIPGEDWYGSACTLAGVPLEDQAMADACNAAGTATTTDDAVIARAILAAVPAIRAAREAAPGQP